MVITPVIGWVLVPIFICIALLFSSWKAGLLAMIPNVLPIVVNFGVMGLLVSGYGDTPRRSKARRCNEVCSVSL